MGGNGEAEWGRNLEADAGQEDEATMNMNSRR